MDPLSVTASIITVLHLTHQIGVLCLDLRSKFKNARQEIDQILDEISSLRTVLEGLARLGTAEDQDDDSSVRKLDSITKADGPLMKCSVELQELADELKKANQSNLKSSIQALSWTFKEKDVSRRLHRIDRLKETLQLALSVDQT